MEPYMLSRLLGKMELQRYVSQKRFGTDKVVALAGRDSAETTSTSMTVELHHQEEHQEKSPAVAAQLEHTAMSR